MIATVPAGASTGLRIEPVLVKDLYRFACVYAANSAAQRISPITKHRALAQSNNPYAAPDDVGLLVAYDGGQCVGYQGILPGRLRTPAGTGKVLWLTANYVLPEFRKRMIGILFIKRVLSMGCDIIATGFEHAGAHMLKGFHFKELAPLTYGKLNLERLDLPSQLFSRGYRLQRRWPSLRAFARHSSRASRSLFYSPIRAWYAHRLRNHAASRLSDIRIHETRRVSALGGDGNLSPRFERGPELVNWMLEFPWVAEGQPATVPPYFFSDTRALARHTAFEMESDAGERLGWAVLFISEIDGRRYVKITDHSCAPEHREALFQACLKYVADCRADEFHWPLEFEGSAARLPLAKWLLERVQRPYMYFPSAGSPIASARENIVLHLADGDCAFT